MVYIINTGSLTRYSFFQTIPYLDSYDMQHVFNGSYDYSKLREIALSISSLRVSTVRSHAAQLHLPRYWNFIGWRYDQNLFLELCWLAVLFQVYINSFLALLNARYYTQVNADTNNPYPFPNPHEVYRPDLHIRALEDEELQVSRKNVFKHPDDEIVHPSRFVKVGASPCVIEDLMTRFSHSSWLRCQRMWIPSRLCDGWDVVWSIPARDRGHSPDIASSYKTVHSGEELEECSPLYQYLQVGYITTSLDYIYQVSK